MKNDKVKPGRFDEDVNWAERVEVVGESELPDHKANMDAPSSNSFEAKINW